MALWKRDESGAQLKGVAPSAQASEEDGQRRRRSNALQRIGTLPAAGRHTRLRVPRTTQQGLGGRDVLAAGGGRNIVWEEKDRKSAAWKRRNG
jgi:hypothetical protein